MEKNLFFSNGNRKVKCTIFNLPAVQTCKPGVKCKAFCYALKAERMYKAVLPCRVNNWNLSKQANFVNDAITILSRKRSKYIRIHESGDYYSIEYFNKWLEIARALPNKVFYSYTKRNDLLTVEVMSTLPSNFTVLYSYESIDKIEALPAGFTRGALISRTRSTCPAQLNKDILCMKQCTKCANKEIKNIIFKLH